MHYCFAMLTVLFCCLQATTLEWRESPEAAMVFADADAKEGTFVLYDVTAGTFTGYNRERAETRFIPASTFKIVNSLIGLSAGVVESVDEVLPYGGEPQSVKEWERDMSLRDAIKISNVPIYQELARRIGMERMRAGLELLDYGNADPGEIVDRFWLDGPLAISAVEQTRFLARLAQNELPLPQKNQTAVQDIVRLDKGDGWELFGKTGAAISHSPHVGWWVGWVRRGDRLYTFALNLELRDPGDFSKRVDVGKACLKALGML